MSITIAIDGPAASGKSTVSKLVAEKLGLTYIDTGAMYRAVTLAYLRSLQNGGPGERIDLRLLEEILGLIEISFADNGKRVLLNGKDASEDIRSQEVNRWVSDVSAVKSVREKLVSEQRRMSRSGNVILDGRDIGTVVLPDANLKIFLVASARVRAERRLKDLEAQGEQVELGALVEEIKLRDQKDSERKESPLRKAPDAIEIDTDNLSIQEVIDKISSLVEG